MTEQEEKALRYDKRQRGIELKKRIAVVGASLADLAGEWQKLGSALRDVDANHFVTEKDAIEVIKEQPSYRPGPSTEFQSIASVRISSFDSEKLLALLKDLQEAKIELREIRRFCKEMGDPLE